MEVKTSDGGTQGGAGYVNITTGVSNSRYNRAGQKSEVEESIGGNITLASGANMEADGAYMRLSAGNTETFLFTPSVSDPESLRTTPIGGPILMDAGSASFGAAGQVNITAGTGFAQPDREIAGQRYGADHSTLDEAGKVGYGGNVTIRGGASSYDHGGSVNLVSGEPGLGVYSTSGNITMTTPDATNSKPPGAIPDGPDKGISGSIFPLFFPSLELRSQGFHSRRLLPV